MAVASSGAIDLDEFHQEAGGSANSNCTINDADIRGLIGKSAGATMAFNEWYGASSGPDVAVFGSGYNGNAGIDYTNTIDYVTISTTGNASDWGDATAAKIYYPTHGNDTYGITSYGGYVAASDSVVDTIDYVTFASAGDAADWGNVTDTKMGERPTGGGGGNKVRGLFCGSIRDNFDAERVEYIAMGSTGNGSNFGDLSADRNRLCGMSSTTRTIFAGGSAGNGSIVNIMEYFTIANTGNATDFGDLGAPVQRPAGVASATRGLTAGGYQDYPVENVNVIEKHTIASAGNGTDFGDLTRSVPELAGTSNGSRAVFAGMGDNSGANIIDYVTIASAGNASDFGDLSVSRYHMNACGSNTAAGAGSS